jgi:hypothetical protein
MSCIGREFRATVIFYFTVALLNDAFIALVELYQIQIWLVLGHIGLSRWCHKVHFIVLFSLLTPHLLPVIGHLIHFQIKAKSIHRIYR